MSELEILKVKSQADWEKWLDENHGQLDGVWLKLAKKGSGETSVSYDEAVESALCWGWIDSQVKKFDEKFYIQKFSPRRPKSLWSKINREKIENLIAAGRMKPAGLIQVQAAQADGRWAAAYVGQSTMKIPGDFKKALAGNKAAATFFDSLNKSQKYAFLWRLYHVKRPDTRARNIEKYIDMLAEHQKFH